MYGTDDLFINGLRCCKQRRRLDIFLSPSSACSLMLRCAALAFCHFTSPCSLWRVEPIFSLHVNKISQTRPFSTLLRQRQPLPNLASLISHSLLLVPQLVVVKSFTNDTHDDTTSKPRCIASQRLDPRHLYQHLPGHLMATSDRLVLPSIAIKIDGRRLCFLKFLSCFAKAARGLIEVLLTFVCGRNHKTVVQSSSLLVFWITYTSRHSSIQYLTNFSHCMINIPKKQDSRLVNALRYGRSYG